MTVQSFRTSAYWPFVVLFVVFGLLNAWMVASHFLVAPRPTYRWLFNAFQLLCTPFYFWQTQSIGVTETELIVHSRLFRRRIPIGHMQRVRAVPMAGGASEEPQELEIEYGEGDRVRVAPIEREAFVAALRARSVGLVVG